MRFKWEHSSTRQSQMSSPHLGPCLRANAETFWIEASDDVRRESSEVNCSRTLRERGSAPLPELESNSKYSLRMDPSLESLAETSESGSAANGRRESSSRARSLTFLQIHLGALVSRNSPARLLVRYSARLAQHGTSTQDGPLRRFFRRGSPQVWRQQGLCRRLPIQEADRGA